MNTAIPRAKVIAYTHFEAPDDVPWSTDADGGQALAEFAGRACYQSWSKPNPATATNADYLRHILEVGHLSVFEHGTVTFYLTGVSRSFTHELVRHRHFSYCLSGDTRVYLDRPNRPKSGSDKRRQPAQTRTLEELWDMWQDRRRTYVKTMTIRTVTDNGHVVHCHIKNVSASGIKPVYRVKTANGRSIKSSLDHLFWRPGGSWSRLGDLSVGDDIVANGVSVLHDANWVKTKVAEGLSTPQIARLADAAPVTVRKWRRIHGCPAAYGSGTIGRTPWNKGASCSLGPWTSENRKRHSEIMREKRPRRPETWSNGNSAANAMYGHLRALGCRMCGTRDIPIELDHIDGNPHNNAPDNVQPLCVPCHHAKTHGTPPKKTYPTKIVSIEYVGEEMTYDIEMDGPYKRFVANGLVVHNSQLSQRYVPERDAAMVEPEVIADDPELHAEFAAATTAAVAAYTRLAVALEAKFGTVTTGAKKLARQAARAVLPNATETRIVVSGNYRAWRHFVAMRATEHADVEIRRVAIAILRELQRVAPNVFADFTISTLADGSEVAASEFTWES